MKLCIPHCKQQLILLEDHTVDIEADFCSCGNMNLLVHLGFYHISVEERFTQYFDSATNLHVHYRNENTKQKHNVTIPAGTVLEISKMYIRNGGWDEDHITFKMIHWGDDTLKSLKGTILISLTEVSTFNVDLQPDEDDKDWWKESSDVN